MLDEVRNLLLKEAFQSPLLLSDLAGLEQYIAESYHNRSFIELLQNADDAKASKFAIIKRDNFLFIANNGRDFTLSDLESLCRSASSSKIRGTAIGYRGVGFKSVVGIAQRIYLVSGEMEISFCRDKTKEEIPLATKVPLIRIPHAISEQERQNISAGVYELKAKGYSTIFIFSDLIANEIEQEFISVEYKSLLFLKNVSKVELLTDTPIAISLDKQIVKSNQYAISFKTNNSISKWLLYTDNDVAIAFQGIDENNTMPNDEAFVYAFLPTEDITGLGALINGDFSTDPSRRHVIFDANTNQVIDKVGHLVLKIIEDSLNNPSTESFGIIKALIPNNDPRIAMMKRHSFSNLLLNSLKNIAINIDFFKNIRLSPTWLNNPDFILFGKAKQSKVIENEYYEINGLINFLKYLGAKESSFENIKQFISGDVVISNQGCCEILSYLISKTQFDKTYLHSISKDWKILISKGQQWSFNQIAENRMQLDNTFLNYFYEKGFTASDLNKFFGFFFAQDILKGMLENEKDNVDDRTILNEPKNGINDLLKSFFSQQNSNDRNGLSIKKWRSAEQQVLDIFHQKGYKVEDVSRQNLGYDLIGISPEGKSIFIEVKSIETPGQRFKLTNNEIAVAQEKKNSFILALLRQTPTYIELTLVQNPIDNLTFNRQCVQWIWECIDYEYNPFRFET